jgi:predicted aldo/keto reductase-like oxidoreductase
MKTLGGAPARLVGSGPGKADVPSLLRYAWDCPIHTAVLGMGTLDQLRENIATARTYKPLTKDERKALVEGINQGKWMM